MRSQPAMDCLEKFHKSIKKIPASLQLATNIDTLIKLIKQSDISQRDLDQNVNNLSLDTIFDGVIVQFTTIDKNIEICIFIFNNTEFSVRSHLGGHIIADFTYSNNKYKNNIAPLQFVHRKHNRENPFEWRRVVDAILKET